MNKEDVDATSVENDDYIYSIKLHMRENKLPIVNICQLSGVQREWKNSSSFDLVAKQTGIHLDGHK